MAPEHSAADVRSDAKEVAQVGQQRRLYYSDVWRTVRSHWAIDPGRYVGQNLETIIVMRVRRDGKILSHRIERRSGNPAFDEAAEQAVFKTQTLPPFPKIYSPNEEEIGIRFRPQDFTPDNKFKGAMPRLQE
jgi:TonB family protein